MSADCVGTTDSESDQMKEAQAAHFLRVLFSGCVPTTGAVPSMKAKRIGV